MNCQKKASTLLRNHRSGSPPASAIAAFLLLFSVACGAKVNEEESATDTVRSASTCPINRISPIRDGFYDKDKKLDIRVQTYRDAPSLKAWVVSETTMTSVFYKDISPAPAQEYSWEWLSAVPEGRYRLDLQTYITPTWTCYSFGGYFDIN